ncbi:ubiquinone biosynthesis protein COQ4, mitochondrial, partial [Auriculariales sp. MPI-PUGE-AT-0066]
MVAALGDVTAAPALPSMREDMLASEEGRRILRDRPRISSSTVDLDALAKLPVGTFGRAYSDWLVRCAVTPDTRDPVRYIADPELAYVMQRYRESHDLYHALCGLPVSVEYELALKYFEFANNGLPMAALGALFGPLRLNSEKRARLFGEYVPWALRCGASAKPLIAVYWEERWQQNLEDMKLELGIWDPPPPRWRKAKSKAAPTHPSVDFDPAVPPQPLQQEASQPLPRYKL